MEVNTKIKEYLKLIDKGLNKEIDAWQFACDLEDFVEGPEMYDELKKANEKFLTLVADDIFDITEPMEPGMDPTEFYSKVREFKTKIEELLS